MVDASGLVTGLGSGSCTITATTVEGGHTASCAVTVTGTISGTTTSGTLAGWDFADGVTAVPVTASTSMNGISTASPSPEATIGQGCYLSSWSRGGFYSSRLSSIDLQQAVGGQEYFSFTVAPAPGNLLTIENLHISTATQNRERSFAVMSSLTGFGTDDAIRILTHSGAQLNTVPITGRRNLPVAVQFRVYVYGYDNQYESAGIGKNSGDDVAGGGFTGHAQRAGDTHHFGGEGGCGCQTDLGDADGYADTGDHHGSIGTYSA